MINLGKFPVLGVNVHAGTLPQAPAYLQKRGLEWLFRLVQEPKRLWRRYLILNPLYLRGIALQKLGIAERSPAGPDRSEKLEAYG